MRVKKTTPQGITLYGWDNDRIYAEYDQNGNAIQETVYFGSTPVALLKNGNTYRIFADQIDTPRVITDNWNNKLWAWDSKPFGETAPNEDVDGDGTNLSYNLRFPWQYYDVETDKHYNFNRDYDPRTGRYIQSDPIGLDGGMNVFGYVSGNPLSSIDPNGLFVFGIAITYENCSGISCLLVIPPDVNSDMHKRRNQYNRCSSSEPLSTSSLPLGFGKAKDKYNNVWVKDPIGAKAWHGASIGNKSYRRDKPNSKKGGYQCVYSSGGKLVKEGKYRGTYDFFAPKISVTRITLHRRWDVTGNHAKNPNAYVSPDLTSVY